MYLNTVKNKLRE